MKRLPRLAIVSTGIRRDLIAPLKNFSRFEILHFYRNAEYADLTPADLDTSLQSYHSPYDLYRRLVGARPDVIQGVEPFSFALQPYLWACYRAARKTRARLLVVSPENRPLDDKYGKAGAALLRFLLRPYFGRANLFIVLNEGARSNLEGCGVPSRLIERMMWGTWGVDVEEFSPSPAREEGNQPAYPPTILYAGRLHQEKGIFYLLDAFPQIRAVVPDAQLVILGDGPSRVRVERLATELTGVCVIGVVKNREMPDFLRRADVLASPSITMRRWEEQIGMTNIQAMACGVPVVSTRSGAIPEYVPDGIGGLLVPERDVAALAHALERLLLDKDLRARIGAAARKHAVMYYDARTNIERAEAILLHRLGI